MNSTLFHFVLTLLFQVLDYLAIGVHELASMSERRIERLVNPNLSELPAFLVKDGGLNNGFMIAHCTAAALGVSVCISRKCHISCRTLFQILGDFNVLKKKCTDGIVFYYFTQSFFHLTSHFALWVDDA